MIQQYINSKSKDRGFTIVELLVVIVVIGILASITIVSYSGITQSANNTKAQTNATATRQVAEVYAAENNHYPRLTTDFASGTTTKLPAGLSLTNITPGTGANATPSATNGLTTVLYQYCGTVAAPAAGAETGARIQFWDFKTSALSTTVLYMGTGSSSGGAGSAPCHTWVTPAT
jgi:prepilin-type N-terminal cleavage/methylation domain-containing protein